MLSDQNIQEWDLFIVFFDGKFDRFFPWNEIIDVLGVEASGGNN